MGFVSSVFPFVFVVLSWGFVRLLVSGAGFCVVVAVCVSLLFMSLVCFASDGLLPRL
jgi:hypothetical protein